MSANALIRWLLPREDRFFDFLDRQAEVAHAVALAVQSFKSGTSAEAVCEAVQKLEHDGDRIAHDLLDALAKTFATPIDREDLQKLSKRLDDIADAANAAARACVLFGVERPTKPMTLLADKLVESTELLKRLIPKLRARDWKSLIIDARTIANLEKDGDRVFRDAMRDLFHDPAVDAKTILREKEVLEDLEDAVDHCDQVADILTGLAVKHG